MHLKNFVKKTTCLVAYAAVALSLSTAAHALTFTDTLPEYNLENETVFPTSERTVGTFSFMIPVSETITSATLTGTFGNSVVSSTAPFEIFGDGEFLGKCLESEPCYTGGLDSFSFSIASLANLLDGFFELTVIQTDFTSIRLGETTLTIETQDSVVPLPTALPLFGTGLAMLGFVGWRRQRKAAAAA